MAGAPGMRSTLTHLVMANPEQIQGRPLKPPPTGRRRRFHTHTHDAFEFQVGLGRKRSRQRSRYYTHTHRERRFFFLPRGSTAPLLGVHRPPGGPRTENGRKHWKAWKGVHTRSSHGGGGHEQSLHLQRQAGAQAEKSKGVRGLGGGAGGGLGVPAPPRSKEA